MFKIFCDRCKKEIVWDVPDRGDSGDYFKYKYATKNICYDCDTEIIMIETIACNAAIEGIPQKKYVKRWLAMYE